MSFLNSVAAFFVGITASISGMFHATIAPSLPTDTSAQVSSESSAEASSAKVETKNVSSSQSTAASSPRVASEGKTSEYSAPIILPTTISSALDTKLDTDIFITPKGTPTLRPPAGWKSHVTENDSYTNVNFVNENDESIGFNVVPNGKDGKRYTAEEYVAGEVDVAGYKKMLRKAPISISGASGYVTEKIQTPTDTTKIHSVVFTLLKDGKVYQIRAVAKDDDWENLSPLLYASLSTMQIP